MGTILASAIFTKAQYLLLDSANTRWTAAEVLAWLNSAQKEIVFHKPNASAVNGTVSLVAGTKQILPTTALSLIDVIRNMGADGLTPGKAIVSVNRDVMDGAYPEWHSSPSSAVVKKYIYDIRDPKTFYVFPPQPASTAQKVEIVYPVAPADLTASTQAINVDDIYEARLIDYILYRAYGRPDGGPGDAAISAQYGNAFYSALGVKLTNEAKFAPSQRKAANSEQG